MKVSSEQELEQLVEKWTEPMSWRKDFKIWRNGRLWQEKTQEECVTTANRFLRRARQGRLLNLGAGMGGVSVRLAQEGWRVCSVDLNYEYCRISQLRAERYEMTLPWVVGRGEGLPFPSECFEGILCWDVIEHVEDPALLLQEAYRVLKPQGVFLLTFPNRFGYRDPHYHLRFLNWLPRRIGKKYLKWRDRATKESGYPDRQAWEAMHYFTYFQFAATARKAGFSMTDTREAGLSGGKRFVYRFFRRVPFGLNSFVCILQKGREPSGMPEIRVGVSTCLKHSRHEATFQVPSPYRIRHIGLPELSLYRLSRFLEKGFRFPKDRSPEKMRSFFFLKARTVDLVHSYNRLVMNRIPWVLDLENFDRLFPQMEWFSPQTKAALIGRSLKSPFCRKILPWSRYAERTVQRYVKDPEILRKVEVFYPTVPRFPSAKSPVFPRSGPVRFLFVGLEFHRKGGDWLLKAFDRIESKARLTIVTRLSGQRIPRGKGRENITWVGPVPRSALLEQYFPDADVLVLPAKYEAFGMVCLEAMSQGLSVIATDIGALPEMVAEDQTGFIVHLPRPFHELSETSFELKRRHRSDLLEGAARESQEQVVSCLHRLLDRCAREPDLCRRLGQKGRERFEELFSPEKHYRQLRRIYEESLS